MANRTLSGAIQEMINNIDDVCREVALRSSKKITKDLLEKAESIVDKYYSYKKGSYTKYGRTYQLYDIYRTNKPRARKSAKGGYVASAVLTFDENELEYHSNSKKHKKSGEAWENGGDVENSYVFNELFLEGMHPWYSGSPVNDNSYTLIQHGVNVNEEFERYQQKYDELYLKDYLNDIIVDIANSYL